MFPFKKTFIGDADYQGPKFAAAAAHTGKSDLQVVCRCDKNKFVAQNRWTVERTIVAYPNCRLARDFERHCGIAAALSRTAIIRIVLQRLAA